MKRLLSFFLAMLLCLSLLPAGALASEEPVTADVPAAAEAEEAAVTAAEEPDVTDAAEELPPAETTEEVPATDGAVQLAAPTELHWHRTYLKGEEYAEGSFNIGYASFLKSENASYFRLSYYNAATDALITSVIAAAQPGSEYTHWTSNHLLMENIGTGDYYFTVVAVGDKTNYLDSEPAKSEVWHFDAPERQLGLCTDVTLSSSGEVTFTLPDDMDVLYGYSLEILYAKTAADTPHRYTTPTTTYVGSSAQRQQRASIPDWILKNTGGGYFSVRVRATSKQITAARSGEWSAPTPLVPIGQAASLPQLDKPTELSWGRIYFSDDTYETGNRYLGYASFRAAAGTTLYQVSLYRAGSDTALVSKRFTTSGRNYLSVSDLTRLALTSGDYYFTVVSLGDNKNTADSDPAVSEIWHYDAPERAIGVCTDVHLRKDGRFHLTLPDDMDVIASFSIEISYAKTESATPQVYTTTTASLPSNAEREQIATLPTWVLRNTGGGYYSVRVRAEAKDLLTAQSGPWSAPTETVYLEAPSETSGRCGEDVTWSLDGDTLTIRGTGATYDYLPGGALWSASQSAAIRRIVVEDGVTSIGSFFFSDLAAVTYISLPDSLTELGRFSFCRQTALEELRLPTGLTHIDTYVFLDSGLKTVYYSGLPSEWAEIEGYNGTPVTVYNPELAQATIYFLGDVNVDGAVDGLDAALVLRAIANGTDTELDPAWADANRDGAVTAADAARILAELHP